MSIWNKVLVGLIALASVGFFYLGARTLKTHTYWRQKAAEAEKQIAQTKAENQRLMDGVETNGKVEQPGIRQVRLELHNLLVDRRRAWFHCPARITNIRRTEGTADVNITIEKPAPHGIVKGTVLCAFEDADAQRKGRYLGQFVVVRVAGKQISLKPATKMFAREMEGLVVSRGAWTLYESIPQDNHEIFAGLSDAEKKALLPADSVAQYLKDGKPASKEDPKENVVDGKYVRPLHDYGVLFRAAQEKHILLTDAIDAAGRDKSLVKESLALAQKQADACTRDIAAAKEELAKMVAQRDLVSSYLAKFKEALAKVQATAEQLLKDNQAKAGRIAKYQLEAAERIDRRTHAMAQSSGAERQ
ncbi:MAG: hypothetical protein ABFC63_05560 [Thermoguttaceae bacterium]